MEPRARNRFGMTICRHQPGTLLTAVIDGARHQLTDRRTRVHVHHVPDRDRIPPEKMGEPGFLIGRELAIKARQRNRVGHAVAPHVGDAQPIERGVPRQPG